MKLGVPISACRHLIATLASRRKHHLSVRRAMPSLFKMLSAREHRKFRPSGHSLAALFVRRSGHLNTCCEWIECVSPLGAKTRLHQYHAMPTAKPAKSSWFYALYTTDVRNVIYLLFLVMHHLVLVFHRSRNMLS